jgi:hypothetical protein
MVAIKFGEIQFSKFPKFKKNPTTEFRETSLSLATFESGFQFLVPFTLALYGTTILPGNRACNPLLKAVAPTMQWIANRTKEKRIPLMISKKLQFCQNKRCSFDPLLLLSSAAAASQFKIADGLLGCCCYLLHLALSYVCAKPVATPTPNLSKQS